MKKNILILSCIFSLFALLTFIANPLKVKADDVEMIPKTPDFQYAQILAGTTLYSKLDDTYTAITTLPETYFVIVAEKSSDKTKVLYSDLEGYVDDDKLNYVDYEPVNKYATAKLSFSEDSGIPYVNIYSKPNANLSISTKLGDLQSSIKIDYYGTVEGASIDDTNNKTWYYVKFTTQDTVTYGYIHKYTYIKAVPISANVVLKEMVKKEPSSTSTLADFDPDTVLTIILILALCIPAVLIMFYLFKKPDKKKTPRHYRE